MKKTLIFSVLASLVFLAGCGAKNGNQSGQQKQSPQGALSEFKDISQAIASGKKVKCTYTYPGPIGQESEVISYIEGKNYRSEFQMNSEKQISVSKDGLIYTWSENTREGTKIDPKCLEELNKPQPEAVPEEEQAQMDSQMDLEEVAKDAGEVKCEKVSTIDFSIPQDVQFRDQCQLMKQQMESLEKLKGQFPNLQ